MTERTWRRAESIEWFIEDQAFSLSSDLAPPPPPPISKLYRPHRKTEKGDKIADGRGGESYGREKAWSSINILYFLGIGDPVESKVCFEKL